MDPAMREQLVERVWFLGRLRDEAKAKLSTRRVKRNEREKVPRKPAEDRPASERRCATSSDATRSHSG
jgi:hypothetical protein